jgi:hypothetical protein
MIRNSQANLKVYSPGYQATEWGFEYNQIVDMATALAQPHRIAVMPVFYSLPNKHEYNTEYMQIRWGHYLLLA